MTTWTPGDLQRIAATDDQHICPFRATYGTLTWIWSVVVDDQLYVRAYNGPMSCQYQSAMAQRATVQINPRAV